jgi:uncharacterized membrane protein YqjE
MTVKFLLPFRHDFSYIAFEAALLTVFMFGKIKEALKIDDILGNVTSYIETRIELLKLELMEYSATLIAYLALGTGVVLTAFMGFIMLNFAIAFGISEFVGKIWAGPLILGVLWTLCAYFLFKTISSKKNISLIRTKILESILQQSKEYEFKENGDSEKTGNTTQIDNQ